MVERESMGRLHLCTVFIDEVFRDFDGATFGNWSIRGEYVHAGARGRLRGEPAVPIGQAA